MYYLPNNPRVANVRLSQMLRAFKLAPDLERLNDQSLSQDISEFIGVAAASIATSMNQIIYSAILDYAADATAVQVKTSIKIDRPDSGRLQQSPQRDKLRKFLQTVLGKEKLPETVDFKFIKHLPYDNTKSPFEERLVEFQKTDYAQGLLTFLTIDAGYGGHRPENLYLFPDEIKKIELVAAKNEEFTQIGNLNSERNFELETPLTAESHYARFRGLYPNYSNLSELPNKKWKTEVEKLIEEIWDPEKGDLFETKYSPFLSQLVSCSGFVLHRGDTETLYEFTKELEYELHIPNNIKKLDNRYIFSAYALTKYLKEPKKFEKGIIPHTGSDIIRTLSKA